MHVLAAFLQESQEMPGAGFGLGFLLVMLALYAFVAYCFQVIANKTHTENAWLA